MTPMKVVRLTRQSLTADSGLHTGLPALRPHKQLSFFSAWGCLYALESSNQQSATPLGMQLQTSSRLAPCYMPDDVIVTVELTRMPMT